MIVRNEKDRATIRFMNRDSLVCFLCDAPVIEYPFIFWNGYRCENESGDVYLHPGCAKRFADTLNHESLGHDRQDVLFDAPNTNVLVTNNVEVIDTIIDHVSGDAIPANELPRWPDDPDPDIGI